MIFTETPIPAAYVLELERRADERGFFARAWCEQEFAAHGLSARVAQINVCFSPKRGTLRGIHYQLPPWREAKTVRCTRGAIYDVVVDLRPDSPAYRQWFGIELAAGNHYMLYVPEGCAHGCQTLMGDTEMYYQTSQPYAADYARGVRYDDPAVGVCWPLPVTTISNADRSWPDYEDAAAGA